ncbi:MAG: NADH-quinone oxidoreductase subunit N [Opitutales bacterium]|jgi:NADH-quinone oxidoreductase subunit N|nr:NADH-quinone oxidoreductase subunit N [Opitutales bacterium]MDP4643495.1 NADH-quinone oxidoreductase subunit N [Opitutales bacterium]MDP4778142.1 NADH-quinone oxidoreductase subunit N [Opitutales bacterium]MDP4883229.1 NADH-quinone oxidoreductase subunit N [Opitutales bacterium]
MNDLLAEFLRGYTANNQWAIIMPEIMLAVLALGLLGAEMVLPKKSHGLIPRLALWGQLFVLVVAMTAGSYIGFESKSYFSGMIYQTDITQFMRGFFLVCSILVCYLGHIYLSKQQLPKTEFYHLVIIISAAMMLLVQSSNFVMLFVALETVTVAFYVLVAYCRSSSLSLEAGLKYLVMGALSSSILLFGIVLLYGVAGNPELAFNSQDALNFDELRNFIALNSDNLLVRVGALLVIAGICFKIGAVPFQIWVPDVYQGSPTPVTAYLAVASKAAGFIVLLQLVTGPFMGLQGLLVPVLSFVAAATILFGNFAAVTQRNVKRLMGLSGIAHAGYILVGVIAAMRGVAWAPYAVIFYLVTYLLASFAVFGVMTHLAGSDDANQELDDYENLARKRPFLGGILACGLGSLAGIPPLGGFIGKLFLFVAAFQAELFGLLGISVLGVVISIYYYFGWVRECYFGNASDEVIHDVKAPFNMSDRVLLGALVVGTVIIGIVPAALPIIP